MTTVHCTGLQDLSSTEVTSNPSEDQRSYSSVYSNSAIGTAYARSMLGSAQAWSAATNAAGQWMAIDLGSTMSVRGVVTTGRQGNSQWVKTYTVATSTDSNCATATYADVDSGQTFTGNANWNMEVKNAFGATVQARCVKIVVKTWQGHISMRAGVLLDPELSQHSRGGTQIEPLPCY